MKGKKLPESGINKRRRKLAKRRAKERAKRDKKAATATAKDAKGNTAPQNVICVI